MKKIVMFAGISLVLTSNVFASDNTFQEGKALFMQSCQMCHNAEVDPPMAPPMFAVQMKYKIATQDKESFINKVTSFATHPTKDKAILKEAVKMLGVMPDMGFKESDVRKVALYIHDETFVPPCLHWKSAMKRFKDSGDMQHYKSHKTL